LTGAGKLESFEARAAVEYPYDCAEVLLGIGSEITDIYSIYFPATNKRSRVFCDMETVGGGWTVCRS